MGVQGDRNPHLTRPGCSILDTLGAQVKRKTFCETSGAGAAGLRVNGTSSVIGHASADRGGPSRRPGVLLRDPMGCEERDHGKGQVTFKASHMTQHLIASRRLHRTSAYT